ncbi:MAG TPA: sodium:proton antiporter [Bacteroidota bacterium]|nr:sodium:proton antiporter [Bacteroidota bacterium]
MTLDLRLLLPVLLLTVAVSAAHAEETGHAVAVNPWMILPFVLLLLAIAVMPFINRHWWEHNYPYVSVAFALVSISYYLFWLNNPSRLLHTGFEYVSFIALIGSLFVVAGGIHIRIRGRSKPLSNVFLLSIGAVLSNFVGTTGASMILIRPYIRTNRYRIKPFHVVFFIFIISNMGGALTPIGDPPLFLGYLKGIPFFWVAETVWFKWAIAMGMILGVFYVLDYLSYHRLPAEVRHGLATEHEEGEVSGGQNVFFLAVILIAVFITRPIFLREGLMALAAAGSYLTTRHEIHRKNDFNFLPIKEVAFLFFGIFATMIPALDWLALNASGLGIRTPGQFFWSTGALSSFLDNAPTYLNFLSAATGLLVAPETTQRIIQLVQNHGADLSLVTGQHAAEIKAAFAVLLKYHFDIVQSGSISPDFANAAYLIANHSKYVQAISLGAVFFGAMTYIGNGPNFMVKSIAQQAGVHCPTFFGYVFKYSIPILLPVFTLVWLLFFFG